MPKTNTFEFETVDARPTTADASSGDAPAEVTIGSTILDDFTRADGGLGASWTNDPTGAGTLLIASNQVKASVAGYSSAMWNTPIGVDAEVSVKIVTAGAVGDHMELHLRNDTTPATAGVFVEVRPVDATHWRYRIYTFSGGVITQRAELASGATCSVLTLRAVGNRVAVFADGTLILTYTDALVGAFTGTYSSIVLENTTWRVDEYAAGQLVYYDDNQAAFGTKSLAMQSYASPRAGICRVCWSDTAGADKWFRFYYRYEATPTSTVQVMRVRTASGGPVCGYVELTTGNALQLRRGDESSTGAVTATGTLTPGQWYRVEVRVQSSGTTTTNWTLNYYDLATETLVGTASATGFTNSSGATVSGVGWVEFGPALTARGASPLVRYDALSLFQATSPGANATAWVPRIVMIEPGSFIGGGPPPPPPSPLRAYLGAYIAGIPQNSAWTGTANQVPHDYASTPAWRTWDAFVADSGGNAMSLMAMSMNRPWLGQRFNSADYLAQINGVRNRGAIPVVTMHTGSEKLGLLAGGSRDAGTTGMAQWFTDAAAWGHPFIFRLNWEQNGNWFDWHPRSPNQMALYSNNLTQAQADYRALWQHYHDLCVAAGATNVYWFWCPNVKLTDLTRYSTFAQVYPGDAYVDIVGVDGYCNAPYQAGGYASNWLTPAQLFDPSFNDFASTTAISSGIHTKPFLVGEFGVNEKWGGPVRTGASDPVTNPQNKADWITNAMLHYFPSKPNFFGAMYYNHPDPEDQLTGTQKMWPVQTTPSAKAAWAASCGDTFWIKGGQSAISTIANPY